jgi:hypothetical protein
MLRLVVLILFAYACGPAKSNNKPSGHGNQLSELLSKRDLYVELLKEHQDEHGFVARDCDALLWSALSYVGGVSLDLTAAQDPDGRWYRRPTKDCFSTGSSKSSISKDMLIGVFFWGMRSKDVAAIEKTFEFGQNNGWVMGEGDITRTFLTPSGQATLAEVMFRIGGKRSDFYRNLPQLWNSGIDGYEAHLQILHILIRGELLGGIDNRMLARIREHYSRSPKNALFAFAHAKYADGNQQEAIELLLNEQWWPSSRLPTSEDRCEPWLFQRDVGADWLPCSKGETHHGGDLIFLTKLIEGLQQ